MTQTGISEEQLKRALKEALMEVFEERRDLLRSLLTEVLEDFELVEDIYEVNKKVEPLKRPVVFRLPEGEA